MIKKLMLFILLLTFLSIFTMDENGEDNVGVSGVEISFILSDDTVGKQSKEYVELFPILKEAFQSAPYTSEMKIPFDAPPTIFYTWFSLVKKIAIKPPAKFALPTVYPIALQTKVRDQLGALNFDEFQFFINIGDKLGMPGALMNCICDIFNQKFLSKMEPDQKFVINNQIIQTYFGTALEPIKSMCMLSEKMLRVTTGVQLNLQPHMNSHYCCFSKQNSFMVYTHKANDLYTIFVIDLLSKEIKASEQRHVIDNNAKNRNFILRCAAQEPYFLSIHPYDERILIHHAKDAQKNSTIQLNLAEGQDIISGDISADGSLVIIGYHTKNEEGANKFIVYDRQRGSELLTIPTFDYPPLLCESNPGDPTTALLTGHHTKQYVATLENNRVKMALGQSEDVLAGMSLHPIVYDADGKYIFGFSKSDSLIYRISAEFLENVEKYDLTLLSLPYFYYAELVSNDMGDIALLSFESGSKKNIVVVDCKHNNVYRIPGDDITSGVIKGYLLIYIEKIENKKYLVFFDVLHKKELMRQSVHTDVSKLLGITKTYELVVERTVQHGIGGFVTPISFIQILNMQCWQEIERYLKAYYFLPSDINWFQQLHKLLDAIKKPSITSLQDWLVITMPLFSNDFRKLVIKCINPGLIETVKARFKIKKAAEEYKAPLKEATRSWDELIKKRQTFKKYTLKKVPIETMLETTESDIPLTTTMAEDASLQPNQKAPEPVPQPTIMQQAWSLLKTAGQIIGNIVTATFRWFFGYA